MGRLRTWVIDFFAGSLLTLVFRPLWGKIGFKLGENAVLGWLDDFIAAILGFTGVSPVDAANVATDWAIPIFAAAMVLWIYHLAQVRWFGASHFDLLKAIRKKLEPWHVIALGFLLAGGGVIWQLRSGPTTHFGIAWNFDDPTRAGYFLSLSKGQGEETTTNAFQATGVNVSDKPISHVSGYIRSDLTGTQIPIFFYIGGSRVRPEDTQGIPPGAQFMIFSENFMTVIPGAPIQVPLSKFFPIFGAFSFVFESDGKTYERRFSANDVKDLIAQFEVSAFPKTAPQVTVSPALKVPSAPPPAPPTTAPQSPVSQPARPLTAYEIGKKLPVVDTVLSILSDDMQSTIDQGPRLQTGWFNAIKDPKNNATYQDDLKAYRDTFKRNAEKLDNLRYSIPQYQDIMVASQQTEYNSVFPKIENFLNAYLSLVDSPNANLQFLMKPYSESFAAAIQEFTQWRNTARSQMVEIRRQISQ